MCAPCSRATPAHPQSFTKPTTHRHPNDKRGSAELFLILPVNFVFRKLWENVISIFLDAKSKSATHLLGVRRIGVDWIGVGWWTACVGDRYGGDCCGVDRPRPEFIRPFQSTRSHPTHTRQDKAELLEYIDEDQLADFCGGKMPYTFVEPADEA